MPNELRRVLVVTPNWPPMSFPDLHRVRTALPYFEQFGWEPLILRVDPRQQPGTRDEQLAASVPETTRTWVARAMPLALTSWFGLRSAPLRSALHLALVGARIIRRERPDVVFFSTTMFPLMVLGRLWRAWFGVPYVLDFQDPWYDEQRNSGRRDRKRRISDFVARVLEPFALRKAAHAIAVSPDYCTALAGRYRWLEPRRLSALPFGAPEYDFELLRRLDVTQDVFSPNDGYEHWVFLGTRTPDMVTPLAAFFRAVAIVRRNDPARLDRIRMHFIGTNYTTGGRAEKLVEPIAVREGVADLMDEMTDRLPYYSALRCLMDARGLILTGSDRPAYSPSRTLLYLLSGKPITGVFHSASNIAAIAATSPCTTAVTYDGSDTVDDIARRLVPILFRREGSAAGAQWPALTTFSSQRMTQTLCAIFDSSAA